MHAHTAPHHLPTAARRAAVRWLAVLAMALVLAQTLGLMHRITHAGAAGVAGAVPQQAQHAQPTEGNWVASLFAGHAGDNDCRLYDPLNHEGAPTVAVLALPLALSSFFLACVEGDFVARWAALFDARGPPSPR